MTLTNAWVRCVCCDAPLDTNDTERTVHIDGDGLAHRACYEREQAIEQGHDQVGWTTPDDTGGTDV